MRVRLIVLRCVVAAALATTPCLGSEVTEAVEASIRTSTASPAEYKIAVTQFPLAVPSSVASRGQLLSVLSAGQVFQDGGDDIGVLAKYSALLQDASLQQAPKTPEQSARMEEAALVLRRFKHVQEIFASPFLSSDDLDIRSSVQRAREKAEDARFIKKHSRLRLAKYFRGRTEYEVDLITNALLVLAGDLKQQNEDRLTMAKAGLGVVQETANMFVDSMPDLSDWEAESGWFQYTVKVPSMPQGGLVVDCKLVSLSSNWIDKELLLSGKMEFALSKLPFLVPLEGQGNTYVIGTALVGIVIAKSPRVIEPGPYEELLQNPPFSFRGTVILGYIRAPLLVKRAPIR